MTKLDELEQKLEGLCTVDMTAWNTERPLWLDLLREAHKEQAEAGVPEFTETLKLMINSHDLIVGNGLHPL